MKQSILITGSEGLLGSILREDLCSKGFTVYRCDKKFSYKLDLTQDNFPAYFKDYKVDTIIHLAGYAGPKISLREMDENVAMSTNVAFAALQNKVSRIIFSSSIHVYDFSNMYFRGEKISETTPLKIHSNPEYYKDDETKKVSHYSFSKIISEGILQQTPQLGLHILNLRLGAVTRNNQPAQNPWGNATFLNQQDLKEIVDKGIFFEGCKNLICVSENDEDFIDRTKLEEFLR